MSNGVDIQQLSTDTALTEAVDGAKPEAMKTTALETKIDEEVKGLHGLLRQRGSLDRQIEAARNRVEALQEALALVTGQPIASASFTQDGSIITPKGRVRPTIGHPDPWENALAIMRARGGEFSTDEVVYEAEARGADLTRDRARSRLAHLVDRKVLKRVREGIFEFLGDSAA